MSSHYIIRDNQSPALLIYKASAVEEHIIQSLLEWSPLVIVDESSLGFVLHNRINVDAVILNYMSETELEDLIGYQKPFDLLSSSELPMCLAMYLKAKGISGLDLVGEFDSSTRKLAIAMNGHFPVYIYSEHSKYFHLNSGKYRKWSSAGRGFGLFPEGEGKLQTHNLRHKGDHTYRVKKEGIVEIESETPLWISEIIA